MKKLQFAFDIGYASIGWSVLESMEGKDDPNILGAGVVLFPKDDCLASARRDYRRLRRNIRATRQRMQRISKLLKHAQIIHQDTVFEEGHPAPFFLAAQALQGKKELSGEELWHVLRWYGHNRGYDGNVQWSNQDEASEDTERVQAALQLMKVLGTKTVAETICAQLSLDVDKDIANFKLDTPNYKPLGVAFPRSIVETECREIVLNLIDRVPGLSREIAELLVGEGDLSDEQRMFLRHNHITDLPRRYRGSLLFGQLIPRFDNRIIKSCPITWATVYRNHLNSGDSIAEAKKSANKLSKVPQADCADFYRYRLARLIANIRVNDSAISRECRSALFDRAKQEGKLTEKLIRETIQGYYSECNGSNLTNMLKMHPDSEEALILDPAVYCVKSNQLLKEIYPTLPLFVQKVVTSRLRKGGVVSLLWLKHYLQEHDQSTNEIDDFVMKKAEADAKKSKKGETKEDIAQKIWNKAIKGKAASGRAPYARSVLKQVVCEVLSGFDPNSPARSEDHPAGEDKSEDGVLYPLLNPDSEVRKLQNLRPLSDQTNNHMIQHRLLILNRLINDMVKEFAHDNPESVSEVVVEVGRELSQFSGMTAKQITSELNTRLRDFKKASEYLSNNYQGEITGGLIRKCRIAMDLDWTCPFTGARYDANHLTMMEKEHLVPFSKRNTNALSALVLTYPEVNRMKGNRTALQFIKEEQGKSVSGRENLYLMTETNYKKFVDKLDTKGHADDQKRKKMRQKLMLVDALPYRKGQKTEGETENGAQEELGFTEGAMTQSSHLMKLATKSVSDLLPNARGLCIPGAVTGITRKVWKVMGCMAQACPDILDSHGHVRVKDEIRGITDLHHALDAIVIGLTQHYLAAGNNGRVWKVLQKRCLRDTDQEQLKDVKKRIYHLDKNSGRLEIQDIPEEIKNQIASVLNHKRIMQHVPSDQSGAKLKETLWRVVSVEKEGDTQMVKIKQRSSSVENGKRIRSQPKTQCFKMSKFVGLEPTGESKLQKIKAAIVIDQNYAIALDPQPTMIPHFRVHHQLEALKQANGGKPVRLLRKGMQFSIVDKKDESKSGIWTIVSIKDTASAGLVVDLQRREVNFKPDLKHTKNWCQVRVATLLKKDFQLLKLPYTGMKS